MSITSLFPDTTANDVPNSLHLLVGDRASNMTAFDHIWYAEIGVDTRITDMRLAYGKGNSDQTFDSQSVGEDLYSLFGTDAGSSPQLDTVVRRIKEAKAFDSMPFETAGENGRPIHYVISGVSKPDTPDSDAVFVCRIAETTSYTLRDNAYRHGMAYLHALLRYSPNFIVIKDLDGRYVRINGAAEKVLGVCADDIVGALPADVLDEDLASQCAKDDFTVLESEQAVHLEQEFNSGDERRVLRVVKFPALDPSGCTVGICTVGTDVTKFKTIEHKLYEESNFDLLTEIPNRLLGIDRLHQAMAQAKRTKRRVGLVVADLGKFTAVNDAFGADAGDQLLIESAWRLKGCTRESDTVARLSGDQFALVLTELDGHEDIETVAEKVLRELRLPFLVEDRSIAIAPSVGLSLYPDDAAVAGALISNAESALAHAKQCGRNTVKLYNGDISREITLHHRISTLLNHALDRGEFYLTFQPLVSPAGETVSAEALLRWECRELGPIGPDKFIPVAEDNGQIHEIGEWVLRKACIAAKKWNHGRADPISVSVNVSPKQVIANDFLEIVDKALRDSRLDPALLKLEITETAFASDADLFRSTFLDLSNMGIALSLDDFGTGYSSLGYLRMCPFDVIKIDRTFLTDVSHDPESQVLLDNIVRLAKSLNLTVVVEGVENDLQVEILKNLDCDQLQGFKFSRPLREGDFNDFIRGIESVAA